MYAYCLFCEPQRCKTIAHLLEHCGFADRAFSPQIIKRARVDYHFAGMDCFTWIAVDMIQDNKIDNIYGECNRSVDCRCNLPCIFNSCDTERLQRFREQHTNHA